MKHSMLIIAAALLGTLTHGASAQVEFAAHAPFVRVDATRGSAPLGSNVVFDAVPAEPESGESYPSHAGGWLQLGNAGSQQVSIDGVRLYAYALETGVYQRIKAKFRLWNAHDGEADPVLDRPVEFIADLTACPCNFEAGQAYAIDIALPTDVFTEGMQLGFSQFWMTDSGNGVLSVSTELVPALDRQGDTATVGSVSAAYGNAGRSPDDIDFIPADAIAGAGIGLALTGNPMQLDVCTGASGFQHQFQEEFDNASLFFQRWRATPNFGQLAVGSGYLAQSAPSGATQFPYVRSEPTSIVIPPTGNFMVRWIAQYTGVGGNGTGEMVISTGTPLNGNDASTVPTMVRAWQDQGGYYIYVATAGGTQQVAGGNGTDLHDMTYCWVDGNVELWKDGQIILAQTAQPAQRPDSIWLGNPALAGAGTWNPVTLQRIWVRGDTPVLTDLIFRDDFDLPPNGD
ncbi:MAG: hypothetical protein EYC71_12045 [Gammaproteobacteria bacterium]|nr:MAG: hypothetical protein EYC71_12045 [Gammaproteobacteria bacterium]